MFTKWLDRAEVILLILLSGFVFWPHGISSITLILLVALRIYRSQTLLLIDTRDLLLLTPAIISGTAWVLGGFAPDGIREVQLWATMVGALVVFKHTENKTVFIHGFVGFSIAQAITLLLFLAFSEPFSSNAFSYHLRETVATTFHLHPTYLSAAWCWAALLIVTQMRWKAPVRYGAFLLMVGMAALCGGRMPMLAFFIVLTLYVFNAAQVRPWQKVSIGGLLVLLLGSVWISPVMRERLSELNTLSLRYEEGQLLTSTQVRTGIWNCAFSVIRNHWTTGVGTGHTRAALENCYHTYEQAEFFEGEFNTHNEWLHFWLSSGILGGLLFTAYCLWLLASGLQSGNRMLVFFLLYFFLIALTENYLSRQAGMMLFSFFVLSYWHLSPQRDTPLSYPQHSVTM